ncbi:GH25 family lysozyme [Lactobacillus paragasseri]|uniref:GH25 family lysozyme n=1 Tax=Lactobacillus paragasseri TaxID=2107999 RepID=UPI00254EFA19|nr:GH25 family lysozyme [Lactobacillus paragasseri]MDK7137159.1 GH25 family lysozyme [Lactobacillus paragasseri]
MTQTIENRAYGVDVSSFNNANVTEYTNAGANFVLVKVSEGLDYRNPKAKAQVDSTKQNNVVPMGYHYAHFGADSNRAVQEGNYAISSAKLAGVVVGSFLACDYEQGSGNETRGDREANTTAILAFLDAIVSAGYKPLLYSGAYLMKNKINTSRIIAKYPDCLWVAAYPLGNGKIANDANFGYFPSMDGVAIWQFTDNWKGLSVDGNIAVKSLTIDANIKPVSQPANTSTQPKTWTDVQGMTWHEEHGTFITGGAINLRWGANTQSTLIATLPAGSEVKYNAWARDNAGRVWLQQPRENGHDGYLVGRVGTEAWGTFK